LQQTKQELAALNASNDEMRQKNVSLDETKDDMEKELNEKVEYIRLLEVRSVLAACARAATNLVCVVALLCRRRWLLGV